MQLKKWQFWREMLKKLLMPYISQWQTRNELRNPFSKFYEIAMARIREGSLEQTVAVKYIRNNGLSYLEIGREIGCSPSTAIKIFFSFFLVGYVEEGHGDLYKAPTKEK